MDSYAAADALDDDRADGGRALRSSPGVQPPVIVLPSVNLGAGSYVSGWLTAYLVATVIFGVGALVGALTHVSHSSPLAKDTAPAAPNRVMPVADSSVVGRITGMADCKWRGDAVRSSTVVLKDRYDLASGCLEITYDTGATVLLQGPATYEVESQNGGYLSVGKLTAKLEKRGEGRGTGTAKCDRRFVMGREEGHSRRRKPAVRDVTAPHTVPQPPASAGGYLPDIVFVFLGPYRHTQSLRGTIDA